MKNTILTILLFLIPAISFADVVTEGEVSHEFTILNVDEFPEYEFYILYTTYHYDRGYQANPPREMMVVQGEYFKGGERSATSLLYARLKTAKRRKKMNIPESAIRLGGREIVAERNARSIRDDYKILAINDSLIELELVSQKIVLGNGKEIEIKKGGIGSGMEIGGIDVIYFALPGVCLLSLFVFFLYRRRLARSATA